MRPVLPLTLLLLAPLAPTPPSQEPATVEIPAPPLDAEPPARYQLRSGAASLEFADGESFTLPATWGGRSCTLERLPTRRFEYPGAIAFDYPDGAKWLAATHVPEFFWWDVVADGEFIMLQRHLGTGTGAFHRDLYADNCLKTGGQELDASEISLGDQQLRGRRIAVVSDAPYVQEIYGFDRAGAAWLLVLNHPAGDAPRPLRENLLASFRFL